MTISNLIQPGTNQGLIKLPSNLGQGGIFNNQGQMFNQQNKNIPFDPLKTTLKTPNGVIGPSVASPQTVKSQTTQNTGLIKPATQTKGQLSTAQSQLSELTAQQDALKQYGLTDTNQLMKNTSGQYIPISQAQTNPITSTQLPQNQNPYTSTPATYGGYVGTLGAQSTQPTQGFNQAQNVSQVAANSLLNATPQQNAAVIAQQQAIQGLTNEFNQQQYNISQGRTNLAEAAGEQGALQNLYAGNLGALQTGLSNILQGNAQQQAAYTGAGNLSNTAMGAATSQQGTQQAGLGAAAGFSAPQNANVFGTYNPVTGQYSGYGGQGGTFAAGQAQGNFNAGQQFQQVIAPAYNAAKKFIGDANTPNTLMNFLSNNPDINPSDINYVNSVKQWAEGKQLSNPKYTMLTQYLNEALNTLTPLIGAGGNISDYKSQIVNAMINPTASSESIGQQISNLVDNIATQKYQSLYDTGQSTANPSTSNNSGGGTTFGNFF